MSTPPRSVLAELASDSDSPLSVFSRSPSPCSWSSPLHAHTHSHAHSHSHGNALADHHSSHHDSCQHGCTTHSRYSSPPTSSPSPSPSKPRASPFYTTQHITHHITQNTTEHNLHHSQSTPSQSQSDTESFASQSDMDSVASSPPALDELQVDASSRAPEPIQSETNKKKRTPLPNFSPRRLRSASPPDSSNSTPSTTPATDLPSIASETTKKTKSKKPLSRSQSKTQAQSQTQPEPLSQSQPEPLSQSQPGPLSQSQSQLPSQSSQSSLSSQASSQVSSRASSPSPPDPPSQSQEQPKKKRRVTPKVRTTEYLDLESMLSQPEHPDTHQLNRLVHALRHKKKIVVIAGAGISVSAGVPDFRSGHGLFRTLKSEHKLKGSGKNLFDAAVYQSDTSTEHFHTMLRQLSEMTRKAKATPFHQMLASLAEEGRLLRLYTQNIDCIDTSLQPLATTVPLNTSGPWPTTIQLHGGLGKMVCTKCHDLRDFHAELFEGVEAPLCERCTEQDFMRREVANKRSQGIGRLRPRIVLYHESNPDDEAIGRVSLADLKSRPDAILVVGTSMKIPGVRRLVREFCKVTRDRRDGLTVWLNLDGEPQGAEFQDCWDLIVRGRSDDVANLAQLRRWDQSDDDISSLPAHQPTTKMEVLLSRNPVLNTGTGDSAPQEAGVRAKAAPKKTTNSGKTTKSGKTAKASKSKTVKVESTQTQTHTQTQGVLSFAVSTNASPMQEPVELDGDEHGPPSVGVDGPSRVKAQPKSKSTSTNSKSSTAKSSTAKPGPARSTVPALPPAMFAITKKSDVQLAAAGQKRLADGKVKSPEQDVDAVRETAVFV